MQSLSFEGQVAIVTGASANLGRMFAEQLGADGTVLLGDPYVFNKDNIGDFDF